MHAHAAAGASRLEPELPPDQVPDPDQSPPLVLPASGRRAGVQHPVQLRQLIPGPAGTGPPAPSTPGQAPRRPARHRRGSADPGDSAGSQRQASAVASFHGRPASRPATPGGAAGNRRGITHCHEKHGPPWTGAWTGRREFPELPVPSVRSRGVISAAPAPVAPQRTYGKEKVYGSIP